ncbi:MAG: class A beta-lactamase-related serine hydrolase [Actinomycetota bacterium]|nr:class A beta-lactamase-related serine hydrolase [Actinomycetota bacterium]
MVRPLALSALVLAAGGVAVLVVAAGTPPRGEQREAKREPAVPGGDSPIYPGLRTVSDLAQPGGRTRSTGVGAYPRLRELGALAFPGPEALEAVRRYVAGRKGRISFAVADTRGDIAGLAADRKYKSASLVKAMVLVAYLDRVEEEGRELTPAQHSRLEDMIRLSDNRAATPLHQEIGPERMLALARRAGMRGFIDTGSWAESKVTAADQARFFAALDRLTPPRHRAYARELLQRVVKPQSWGVPQAARPAWRVLFKGGWRPGADGSLVHQAARLERGPRTLALAVLTEGNPGQRYGEETIRRITALLLGGSRQSATRFVIPSRPQTSAKLAPIRTLTGGRAPSPPPLERLAR